MSVTIWNNPNDPNPEDPIDYKIGTVGFEYNSSMAKGVGVALDIASKVYPATASIASFLVGLADGDGAWCPTYGSWAGKGWSAGKRGSEICASHLPSGDCLFSSLRCFTVTRRRVTGTESIMML